jgi:hypothetical protein
VDQLSRTLTLVAVGGLDPEPAQLAHPDPLKDARDGRQRPIKQLGDLRAAEPQPPQRGDHLHGLLLGSIGDHARRRGAIHQARRALDPVAPHPFRARTLADFGRRGGLRQRPPALDNTAGHPLALSQ